jgi:adenosylcobinamide-GDP ribazoletransferase
MKWIDAFFMTFSMFCAIPCPYRPWREELRPYLLLFFPAVGAVMGALWTAAAWVCLHFGVAAPLTAAVIAAMPYFVTGFFHLDGFLDTNDALLSRRDREERLRILKDSRVGAFAVISFGLLLLFAFAAGLSLAQKGFDVRLLAVIPVGTRAAAAFAMTHGRPLPTSQYNTASMETVPPARTAILLVELLLPLALAWVWLGTAGLLVCAAAEGFYALAMLHAARDLGGVSGDLSGYALTLGELGALIVCVLL